MYYILLHSPDMLYVEHNNMIVISKRLGDITNTKDDRENQQNRNFHQSKTKKRTLPIGIPTGANGNSNL